jgi:hypothetical protein
MNINQFEKNDNILYVKNNQRRAGKIIDIHYDNSIPYYTIILNRSKLEIQTINKYLKHYKIK